MNEIESLQITISTLLTKLELKKQRDGKSRELINQMKDVIVTMRDDYDIFIRQCEEAVACFNKAEQERQPFESKFKRELVELDKFNKVKQKAFNNLMSLIDSNVMSVQV